MPPLQVRSTTLVVLSLLGTGCATNRHLIFFTNTTLGIEIAAEPAATTPAKFVVGYKRAEGVIDPIAEDATSGSVTWTKVLRPEGHSVLAKLNFGATGAGANATNAQWFATGEAARLIAQAPGIAGAVTGSAEIAMAAAGSIALGSTAAGRLTSLALLDVVYDGVKKQSTANQEAAAILARMDAIDATPVAPPFMAYDASPVSSDTVAATATLALPPKHTFKQAVQYHGKLSLSVETLRQHLDPALNPRLQVETRPQTDPPTVAAATAAFIAQAMHDYGKQQELLAGLDRYLSRDPAVIAGVEFFFNQFLTRPAAK